MAILNAASGDLIADRRYLWGRSLAEEGDYAGAADLFAQAAEAAPGFAAAWHALGEMLLHQDKTAEAVAAFRRAVAADPADACGASLQLTRLAAGANTNAAPMPDAYVRALFDQYAPRFDAALRGPLAYRAPELLHDAMAEACAAHGNALHFGAMLDIGCGTGLGSEPFRAIADYVEGFDLSPAMVAQARAKGVFDRVYAAGIDEALAAANADGRRFDFVLAADVFPYVADLAPLMPRIAACLAPRALLAFTVETHDGDGVLLRDTLRYAHGRAHVKTALAAAGFRALILRPCTTRTEKGAPVPGLLAVAQIPERLA